tara:strand:- start:517 stop:747 length:231 start_codon:yes stop_codon:yes gene_type:complete
MSYQVIQEVNNIETSETDWWMLYNESTQIVSTGPMRCSGITASPHIMVIADTEEEVLEFIEQEGLTLEDTDHTEFV